MEDRNEIIKASKRYRELYNLIQDNDYHPTTQDFEDLAMAQRDYDSAYVDSLYAKKFEEYISKGDI